MSAQNFWWPFGRTVPPFPLGLRLWPCGRDPSPPLVRLNESHAGKWIAAIYKTNCIWPTSPSRKTDLNISGLLREPFQNDVTTKLILWRLPTLLVVLPVKAWTRVSLILLDRERDIGLCASLLAQLVGGNASLWENSHIPYSEKWWSRWYLMFRKVKFWI